jgi:flavin reductase (DIM6/NTAB) family NADH-FMN oxidoreductase RutF
MATKLMPIAVDKLSLPPVQAWNDWLLLTAGDFAAKKYNAMTVGWGSMGVMWGKPFVQVVVRPTRHTHGFMQRCDTFTVCAFPAACRPALNILGTKSGRDGDKIAESGLTPVASRSVAAPSFKEAELVIECRKIYAAQFNPAHFIADFIAGNYTNDYHWSYYGELVAVSGVEKYAGG